MKYRTRLQIVAEILEIVKAGARKTHIMYRANLSYRLLCQYLDDVLKCKLVNIGDEDHYFVSPNGMKFLQRFYKYSKRCELVRKQLELVAKERALLEEEYMENSPRIANVNQKET